MPEMTLEYTLKEYGIDPKKDLTIDTIVRWLEEWQGDFTLQTCFLRGEHNGQIIDNTTADELEAWYSIVRRLRPKQIMIYVIDRKTPVDTLEKISRDKMEEIAAPLIAEGFHVIISA